MKAKFRTVIYLGLALAAGSAQAALVSQFGILDLTANGGINPNTGNPWQAGDQYRLAFHTRDKFDSRRTNIADYNLDVTNQANLNPALAGSTWVVLGSTQAVNVQVNTGTTDTTGGAGIGGAGVPVYAMDGMTAIARNNSDIWNAWSNPFDGNSAIRISSPPASQNVHYSPFLDQFGNGDTGDIHGVEVWTGSNSNGTTLVGQELGNPSTTNWGSSNANNTSRVWNRGNTPNGTRSLYALSEILTVSEAAVIPEPSSLGLLGFAGVLLAFRRRK